MRTRTIAQRRAQDQASGARRSSRSGSSSVQRSRTTVRPPPMADEEELTAEEAQAVFESPYDNQQPRSHMSLARAATVAAVSPANRRHLRALPFRPLEYRRADGSGRREIPHESDADNWVPPPPAYTAKAEEAESVSLSHPNAPPAGRRRSRGSSSGSGAGSSSTHRVPPVPALPTMSATVNPAQLSPSGPYQSPGQSLSATDLSLRRPSLIHPTTYPSPESSTSLRRRGSTPHTPPLSHSYALTPHIPVFPPSASSTAAPTRRPSLFSRRTAQSTISTPPAPVPTTPDLLRRGSAPLVVQPSPAMQFVSPNRRPVPAVDRPLPPNPPLNPTATPVPRQSVYQTLPRLVPPPQQQQFPVSPGQMGAGVPLSAPPRAQRGAEQDVHGRLAGPFSAAPVMGMGGPVRAEGVVATGRDGLGSRGREGRGAMPQEREREKEKGRRRMGCAVM